MGEDAIEWRSADKDPDAVEEIEKQRSAIAQSA